VAAKRWILVLCCSLLGACANISPPPGNAEGLFDDALFAAPSVKVSAADVLALSPAMREVLRTEIAPVVRGSDPRRALVQALYRNGRLRLDYDAQSTRTAAEAFEARAGNCLSLVIMTAAFAREAGLPVRYRKVSADDTWSRSEGLVFAIGHINLALGQRPGRPFTDALGSDWIVVDFYPGQDILRQRYEVLSESRVLALYMNNKSAEALAAGQADDAYAWAGAAIVQDPTLGASFNLLGVVYAQRGHWQHAERALREALRLEPGNLHAMSNRVAALTRLGRDAEARVLAAELQRRQPLAPFAAFDEGLALLRAGRIEAAEALFKKELGLTAQYHEVHFWLAVAQFKLGARDSALQHLKTALDNSTTRQQQAVYAAKLDHLKSLGVR
jgi:tetratricopeptide (TPR) repeat protein